jgi:hypothetical protein
VKPAAAAKTPDLALVGLVKWAMRAAQVRARMRGLDESELINRAVAAVLRALRDHPEGTALDDEVLAQVRGRVWDALDDEGKKQNKRRRREPFLDDLVEHLGDDEALPRALGVEPLVLASPEDSVLAREPLAKLDREVARLAPADRRLYTLRRRRGLPWDAISSRLGIPARTLRFHDRRICDHLTAALRALYAEGE